MYGIMRYDRLWPHRAHMNVLTRTAGGDVAARVLPASARARKSGSFVALLSVTRSEISTVSLVPVPGMEVRTTENAGPNRLFASSLKLIVPDMMRARTVQSTTAACLIVSTPAQARTVFA